MNKFKKLIVNKFAGSDYASTKIRVWLYNICGLNVRTHAIFPNCFFEGDKLTIGRDSWINRECYFDCEFAQINIGENCGIGMQVMFCTSSHEIGNAFRRGGKTTRLPISVGTGCWIGARATILPGVTIGSGCIIAAGAVVTKDCEPNSLYAGVPAKKIKDLSNN